MTVLSKMTPGQSGKVVGLTADTPITRRLCELGIFPGREIKYLRDAPLKDPMEIQVGPCCLSLRHSEAECVAVEIDE